MGNGKRRYDLIAIFFAFSLAIMFEYQEVFSLIEDETLSYRQILRTHYGDPAYTTPSEDIVIVYTDEQFYEEYGVYPLRRVDLSTLIVRLANMGAAVIGVDMLLDFNSAYGEDQTLEDALQEAGNVLLVSQAQFADDEFESVNRAIPRFDDYTSSGYSNISANSAISESIVRLRVYPEIAEEGEWPFAVQAVSNFLYEDPALLHGSLVIGDEIDIPFDQFNDIYIDYPLLPPDGEGGTVQLHGVIGLSASEILFALDQEELEDLSFIVEDKIVLIGEVAEVAHDEFETPVGNVYGVEIIANTITSILRNGPLQAASFLVEAFVAIMMLALFLGTRVIQDPLPRNAVSVGILAFYILLVTGLYVTAGVVLSMSYIVIASVFAIAIINARFYLTEMGQKTQIRNAFGQYLSPRVVADLVKDPGKLMLGGEEREMSAFFSDIASFSTLSEEMTPTELVNLLNEYLTDMCNIIIATEGTIDKFEGDAIIAFWGAPTLQEDHAVRACLAAIDMQKRLGPLRQRWAEEGKPQLSVRMGVNSGPMVVGNMGSAQRMNYTIIGDAVNLAARLEGANKAYGSRIMISETTYRMCKDEIDVRELDTIRVVGKHEPVTVYEVLERKGETTGLVADLIHQFEKALGLYKGREFEAARDAFRLCTSIDPEDGPSKAMLARCQAYVDNPPKASWDGVFVLEEKG